MIKKLISTKDFPFQLFTVGTLILLTVPTLIQDGMFLDGILYTSVSHNLATGTGTFWQPVSSPFYGNSGSIYFHEHPPLAFGIQSVFYKLLGDSMYVERFYIFMTMCLTAFFISILWKTVFKNEDKLRSMSWLPVLVWIIIPSCSWSYSNNMMENTMGLFDLIAVIFMYKSCSEEKHRYPMLLLSGLFVFLATFSKGIPGFFPLAVPASYWLVFRKGNLLKPVIQTIIMLSVPAFIYLILFNIPESRESLMFYVTQRLFQRVSEAPTVSSRFYIIGRLFSELLPLFIIAALTFSIIKFRKIYVTAFNFPKQSAFLFLTGLSAAAPIALTMVQRGFYLVPSFPYFGLAFAALLSLVFIHLRDKVISVRLKLFRTLSLGFLVFAIVLSAMQKGKTSRDRGLLHDVHTIGNTLPRKSAITISQDIANNCSLECYFIRYYDIGLHIDGPERFLLVKKEDAKPDSVNFSKMAIDTRVYDLYVKKEAEGSQFPPATAGTSSSSL